MTAKELIAGLEVNPSEYRLQCAQRIREYLERGVCRYTNEDTDILGRAWRALHNPIGFPA